MARAFAALDADTWVDGVGQRLLAGVVAVAGLDCGTLIVLVGEA